MWASAKGEDEVLRRAQLVVRFGQVLEVSDIGTRLVRSSCELEPGLLSTSGVPELAA